MRATSFRRLFSLLLSVFLQTSHSSFAQSAAFSVNDDVKKLSLKNAPLFSGVSEVLSFLADKDSAHAIQKFNELENNGNPSNEYFTCRFNLTGELPAYCAGGFFLHGVSQPFYRVIVF